MTANTEQADRPLDALSQGFHLNNTTALLYYWGRSCSSDGKESACSAGDLGWVRKIPRREWQPTPVLLPGEFHEQRSLVDYSLWGR